MDNIIPPKLFRMLGAPIFFSLTDTDIKVHKRFTIYRETILFIRELLLIKAVSILKINVYRRYYICTVTEMEDKFSASYTKIM